MILDIKTGVKIPATTLQVSAYWELEINGTSEGLEFSEQEHIFTFNNVIQPSVTFVLSRMGLTPDYSSLDPFYAARGHYLHRATELYDKGTLDPDTVDDEIAPYLEQYKKAKQEFPFTIEEIEVKLRHQVYSYAGIIDRIVSGGKSYVLYLTKEGFKLEEVANLRRNLNIFLSALNVLKWKQEYNKEDNHG